MILVVNKFLLEGGLFGGRGIAPPVEPEVLPDLGQGMIGHGAVGHQLPPPSPPVAGRGAAGRRGQEPVFGNDADMRRGGLEDLFQGPGKAPGRGLETVAGQDQLVILEVRQGDLFPGAGVKAQAHLRVVPQPLPQEAPHPPGRLQGSDPAAQQLQRHRQNTAAGA